MVKKLSAQQCAESLKTLPGWAMVQDRSAICKTFKFANFDDAWAFMSRVAALAKEMDHHPEWSNVYNRVEVTLTTHSAAGATELDMRMAQAMNDYTRL